jgi:hypothetical protein
MKAHPFFPRFTTVTAVNEELPKILVVLPSFALAYAAALYIVDSLEGVQEMIRGQHDGAAKENGPQYVTVDRRQLVLVLQLLVGSLVTFGGSAYIIFAVNPLGTAFGSGHVLTGLAGLTIGIAALGRTVLPRKLLLGINILTIAYSAVSDAAAGALSLLPTSAFHDSVIGTLAAIIMSCLIVYLVTRR